MDAESQQKLARLIRTQRTAALGTLRDGSPLVSMVLFAAEQDFSSFILHVSRLAHHTQDILKDPHVSLMIAETDDGNQDPQVLARVSIQGEAIEIAGTEPEYHEMKTAYLNKYPQAALNFQFGDFSLFRVPVHKARYVAGFGKIFNLRAEDFQQAAKRSL